MFNQLYRSPVRLNGCYGTSLTDVISPEMCFTVNDVGFDMVSKNVSASGNRFSDGLFMQAVSRCLTHEDIIRYTMHPVDNLELYSYDRISEKYSWYTVEPKEFCPNRKHSHDRLNPSSVNVLI